MITNKIRRLARLTISIVDIVLNCKSVTEIVFSKQQKKRNRVGVTGVYA